MNIHVLIKSMPFFKLLRQLILRDCKIFLNAHKLTVLLKKISQTEVYMMVFKPLLTFHNFEGTAISHSYLQR